LAYDPVVELTVSRDLSQFDPFSAEIQADLTGWFGALRRQAPVHHNEATGLWFVTDRELLAEALRHPDVFSNDMEDKLKPPPPPEVAEEVARIRSKGWDHVPAVLYLDPPAHTRQRALLGKAFTLRVVRNLEPALAALVDDLIDGLLAAEQPCDFMAHYALRLPGLAIASMLNVPTERLDDFVRWADSRATIAGNRAAPEAYLRAAEDDVEFQHFLVSELERRRVVPQDDLMTAMLHARLEAEDGVDGEPLLSLEEIIASLAVLLVAGTETTTTLLGSTMRHLCENPALWDWLAEDPADRAGQLVEESLRMFSPAQCLPRITTRDTVLGGVAIPAGAVVFMVFASGCRDEGAFPDPDEFRCPREHAREHMAFGHGTHYCLGAPLARLETTLTWQRLATRVRTPVLGPGNSFPRRPGFVIPSLRKLSVELVPRV
jgi:cytochrome P450